MALGKSLGLYDHWYCMGTTGRSFGDRTGGVSQEQALAGTTMWDCSVLWGGLSPAPTAQQGLPLFDEIFWAVETKGLGSLPAGPVDTMT